MCSSPRPGVARLSVWLVVGAALSAPAGASAQSPARPCDADVGSEHDRRSSTAACAPDQALGTDASRPARRFASYSDVVSLVRGRVSVGLVAAPFPDGSVARLRVDLEVVTRLRSPRGLAVVARVGVNALGTGLDGLWLATSVSYARGGQAGGAAALGAEAGYARRFQALFLAVSAGASVSLWSRERRQAVRPSVRLLLGHAFY